MSEAAPSPFIAGTKQQFAWDSTSLGLLKTCPRKYSLTIIDGWRKKDESVHLTFGIHYHKALETYEQAVAEGADYDGACDAALAYCLEATWDQSTGLPWTPDNSPKKNRETLVRSVLWYLEEYKDDPAKTIILANGKAATELSFRFGSGIKSSSGQEYILSGHMDRLVEYAGDTFVMDHKTTSGSLTSYFFGGFQPDNQMTLYTLAGKVVYDMPVSGVIINGAQVIVGTTAFGRGFTLRTAAQLEEFLAGFESWMRVNETFVANDYWPMNETACNNYGGCPFKGVCSRDPAVRQHFLKTDFEVRHWNPLETR